MNFVDLSPTKKAVKNTSRNTKNQRTTLSPKTAKRRRKHKRPNAKPNAYFRAMMAARKKNAKSFMYNGNTYYRHEHAKQYSHLAAFYKKTKPT